MAVRLIRRARLSTLLALALAAACNDAGTTTTPPPPPPPPPPVTITVSPTSGPVLAGGNQALTATVTNSTNTAVTWTSSGGTVNGSGNAVTWTAPAAAGSYTVTATSTADATKTASATFTVPTVAVTVAALSPDLFMGERRTLTATVTGAAEGAAGVTWTATCGTFVGTGNPIQYDAPATPGTCTVTATSTLAPTKSGQATVTVRPALRVASINDASDGACTWTHCSLREAIIAANATPARDTIVFGDAAVGTAALRAPAIITLTSALPEIAAPLVILGPGMTLLTIDAAGSIATPRRVLSFSAAISAVSGLTLRGGVATSQVGGGVQVRGGADVTLTDVTVADNEGRNAQGGGLAVAEASTARLVRVNVDNNKTFGANVSSGGIAVLNGSTLIMTNGRVRGSVSENGWGGGMRVLGSTATLTGTAIENNQANGGFGGGGIYVEGTSQLTLSGATISGNSTPSVAGGGLLIRDASTVSLTNTTISGNTAPEGGGLFYFGSIPLTVTGGAITGNTATGIGTGVAAASTGGTGGGVYLSGAAVTFDGTTISNNITTSGAGGGLRIVGTALVTLTNTTVSGNKTQGIDRDGGGIWMGTGSKLTMTGGSINANETAIGWGAGIIGFGATLNFTNVSVRNNIGRTVCAGAGLSILDGSVLTMTGGNIKDNQNLTPILAGFAGTGGGLALRTSVLTMDGTEISGNTSTSDGGGIYAQSGTSMNITNANISGNVTNTNGGGMAWSGTATLAMTNSVIENNQAKGLAASSGFGGGILKNSTGAATINDTRIANNTSTLQGGGLQVVGSSTTTLRRVTISGNISVSGGGVTSGNSSTLVLEHSTVSGNTATGNAPASDIVGVGGGVWLGTNSIAPVIRNTTISGNSASKAGGGVNVFLNISPAVLTNVTIVGNTVSGNTGTDFGAGIGVHGSGTITVNSTLLSGNLRAGVSQNCGTATGTITSGGFNLSADATCTSLFQGTDKNNQVAGINATLANNGGTTFTHALLVGSVAINAGNSALCTGTLFNDQRNFTRVGVCDIGAFEFGGVAAAGRAATPAAARAPVTAFKAPALPTGTYGTGPGVSAVVGGGSPP